LAQNTPILVHFTAISTTAKTPCLWGDSDPQVTFLKFFSALL
jgi:hypothetical protein